MNKLIIGIPVKNDKESLMEMLNSLTESTNTYDKIVLVVGKGTNKETMEWLEDPLRPDYIEVINAQTETPLEAYNVLFDLAKKEKSDLFLTQTDVLFPKLYKRDWLKHMKNLAQSSDVGAVTCLNGYGTSGPDYINGLQWLGGWCTYYPYRTIEKVGGYDKDFPNGYGVDIDHTYRIYKAGLKMIIMNYWVDHHMMNERIHDKDKNTEQMKQESSKYFKKKWSLN